MVDHNNMPPPSLWRKEPDEEKLLLIGKLAEEASELAARAARCIIQGLDGVDPDTGDTNYAELMKEIADVLGLASLTIARLNMDNNFICTRAQIKSNHKQQWLDMVKEDIKP